MLPPDRSRLSIRKKVVALSTLTAGICLCLAAVIIIFIDYSRLRSTTIETTQTFANIVGFNAAAALAFDDPEAGKEVLSALSTETNILTATIYSADGKQFSSYKSANSEHHPLLDHSSDEGREFFQKQNAAKNGAVESIFFTPEIFSLWSPIEFNGFPLGILNISIDLAPLWKRLSIFAGSTLAILLLAFVLAYLLASWLMRSVTTPIEDIAKTIQEVTEGNDYSRRIEHISRDELGDLANDFNFMLRKIQERDSRLEELVQELKSATEAKSAFLANMSHEIRTPMNGILGITSLLLDNPENDKKRAYFKTIDSSAKSLMHLIDDILDLSKIESGHFAAENLEFDLNDTVEELQNLFTPTARQKGMQLSVVLAPDTPTRLVSDMGRLRQVLTNLVGNAIKFTETGSVSVAISAKRKSFSEAVFLFEVIDTGIGVSTQAQARIFSDFAQADESVTRSYGGTGLGLSVSKNIVELMRGEIGVDSAEGEGSRFWFTLPVELPNKEKDPFAHGSFSLEDRSEKADLVESPGNSASYNNARAQYQARILIVDDSEVNRFILIETMRTFGLDTVAVDSGAAAIAAVKTDHFDLIVMDIQMPDMSGIAATKRIRRWEQTIGSERSIPIIAFSANAMLGDRERFLQADMDDYLSKPMQMESLDAVLQKWLGRYRLSAWQ